MRIEEKVKRFISDKRMLAAGDKVVVAVSGGPDSLCLLHIFYQLSLEKNLALIVAHMNHCLRPEAQEEADGVAKIASAWGLHYEERAVNIRKLKQKYRLSEEDAGRRARYRFLYQVAKKYNAGAIALGHHLDDQAETVLLNIIRGTGVDGLAGMRPKRIEKEIKLIRPLLCLRRVEIESYCRENKLEPFTDSSNLETEYTRNKLRLQLIPQLEKDYNPKIKEALYNLAKLAAADRHYLQGLALRYFERLARSNNNETRIALGPLLQLPQALRGRLLRIALRKHLSPRKFGRKQIEQLLELCRAGSAGGMITLPGDIRANCVAGNLVLGYNPVAGPAITDPIPLKIPGKTPLPGKAAITAHITEKEKLSWPPPKYRACLDYEKLVADQLHIRTRLPGDRFYPQGAPGRKKLKDFLIDQKTPLHRRDVIPLVTCGDEIIWIAGLRIAHPYRVTDDTTQVLSLDYRAQIYKNIFNATPNHSK